MDNQMAELRNIAFSGATHSPTEPVRDESEYKGFKTSITGQNYGEAKIVEMSPAEYLRRISFQFGDGSTQSILRNATPAVIRSIMTKMLRGTRYRAPSLDYKRGSISGNERAIAALLNGYQKIPVLVIE